ncbi:MAG TPA: hypothetical protein VLK26_09935 [Rudaea sp.]|nr:hypothetical protein [Rudaea sp.]
MSERDLKNLDLKNLFRRFAGARGTMPVPDVEDLLALTQLPHAEDAASPLRADLLRFSRELEPVSAQLSADLAAALGETNAVVAHRRASPRRVASAPHRWRVAVASAMAASLIVAVTMFATRRDQAPAPVAASAAPDRIFAGFDERNVAASKAAHGDQIFRANFLPDEIFSSSKSHEG